MGDVGEESKMLEGLRACRRKGRMEMCFLLFFQVRKRTCGQEGRRGSEGGREGRKEFLRENGGGGVAVMRGGGGSKPTE